MTANPGVVAGCCGHPRGPGINELEVRQGPAGRDDDEIAALVQRFHDAGNRLTSKPSCPREIATFLPRSSEHLGSTEHLIGGVSLGQSAGVRPIGVARAQISSHSSRKPVSPGKRWREGRLPAFLEDRLVKALDSAVGLGAARHDAAVMGTEAFEGGSSDP